MSGKSSAGFSLVELLVILAIIASLATIAMFQYRKYVDSAKRMVSVSAVTNLRKLLEEYGSEHGGYPLTIDFTSCLDQDGRYVVTPSFCSQLKEEVFSFDSYISSGSTYQLIVKAKDSLHTVIEATPQTTTY